MTRTVLVTGGAGFIGANAVARLVRRGDRVLVLDNLSRAGADANLAWLRAELGADAFELRTDDLRDAPAVARAAAGADLILHLAAQVAVTCAIDDPRTDFEVNAMGTLNVVEAARASGLDPVVLYASTNKVYGTLDAVPVSRGDTRYRLLTRSGGISEDQPFDPHTPYGCSKGAGDRYVVDYHRTYGLPTVVLRQSCIYGPRQLGTEEQGWVAWFVSRAALGRTVTIYGDGRQVRDLLYIDDLLDAYDTAVDHIDRTAGRIYNLGGGPAFSTSVWHEFAPLLEAAVGRPVEATFDRWRPGDQKVFVSDITRFARDTGWHPRVAPDAGVRRLADWVVANRHLFR